jgi:hypothetical protein|tara:strand:- start:125 stop:1207 length:1083 start_codon:yes stop_codon:yes gene_type:complete
MAFFTKIDYNRQLRQTGGTATFSGSSVFEHDVTIGSVGAIFSGHAPSVGNCTVGAGITGCGEFMVYKCKDWTQLCAGSCIMNTGSTGYTFMVGPYSSTSASSVVTITPFSAVTGYTAVLSIGKVPTPPLSGSSTNPGISASTLQIGKLGLLPSSSGLVDLQLDEFGNVIRGSSSSRRYKTDLRPIGINRYTKLLDLSPYFFKYIETGGDGFGLIAEELEDLGFDELVVYDSLGRPDNIRYNMLSVTLLSLLQGLYKGNIKVDYDSTVETDIKTKVISSNYTTDGEYLLVITKECTITLNSQKDKKIKIKSLSNVDILPDIGLLDNKWKSITLDGDSCIELVFVSELNYWVIVSSDGLKDS